MTLDRQAFIDILGEGKGDIGTATLPGPEGQWAMPKDMREKLPGYGPDVAKSRAEAMSFRASEAGCPPKVGARGIAPVAIEGLAPLPA